MLPSNATVEEKSLALAELMEWHVERALVHMPMVLDSRTFYVRKRLEPYSGSIEGRAQFAAILIESPEVFNRLAIPMASKKAPWFGGLSGEVRELTQANILDEILRMKGRME